MGMDEQKISALLQAGLKDGAYPSYALAVGKMNDVLFQDFGGVTRLCGGEAVTGSTLYDMASLSKVMSTSMVAFRMIEDGRLGLYDTMSELCGATGDHADITVYQLMTHTSGMSASFPIENKISRRDELQACLLREPLSYKPGEHVVYSCMGYLLLCTLLESISGKRLDDLAHEYVFAPLGMLSTGYLPVGNAIPPHVAATEFDLCGVVHDEKARHLGGVAGNAGVFSTLTDMTIFARMLAQGGAVNGARVLSPAMLRTARRNYTPGMEQHRGLGFHLGGVPFSFMGDVLPGNAFGHTGFTGTSLVVEPESGVWTVLLTNRVHPSRDNMKLMRVRRLMHNMIYSMMLE